MKHIMNSAMMPCDGVYVRRTITREEAKKWLRQFGKTARSWVGYPATAAHIAELAGFEIPVNRGETTLQDEDEVLVVKLRYRVQNPELKSSWQPSSEDWEYLLVSFKQKEV